MDDHDALLFQASLCNKKRIMTDMRSVQSQPIDLGSEGPMIGQVFPARPDTYTRNHLFRRYPDAMHQDLAVVVSETCELGLIASQNVLSGLQGALTRGSIVTERSGNAVYEYSRRGRSLHCSSKRRTRSPVSSLPNAFAILERTFGSETVDQTSHVDASTI